MAVVGAGMHDAGKQLMRKPSFCDHRGGRASKSARKAISGPAAWRLIQGHYTMSADSSLMFDFIVAEDAADKMGAVLFVFGELRVTMQVPGATL